MTERLVVVGGGLAGVQTVAALRQQGYSGDLVLVGAEREPPYDRPPLSKQWLLAGGGDEPEVALPFDARRLEVEVRAGTAATGLRPRDRVVETASGDLPADAIVVATGSEPIRLPGEGAVHLRTRADAERLKSRLVRDARVVICGAGWIGAEVATAARHHGARVTVVEQAATPVGHVLPEEVTRHFVPWYAAAGVELRTGTRVRETGPDGVRLDDGTWLPADLVVVGVGVRASCAWLAGSGIGLDRGVLVGADLRADRDGVFAVGDVVARWSPRYAARIRGEHWDDALRAPTVLATNLLGGAATYDPVPYVWSEQFGRRIQFAGRPPTEDRAGDRAGLVTCWRGDPGVDETWAVFWVGPAGVIQAAVAVDRPRDLMQARRLAEREAPVDIDRLADPATPVRSCARAGSGVAGSGR